jgi:hypothetical protein
MEHTETKGMIQQELYGSKQRYSQYFFRGYLVYFSDRPQWPI